jgi:hypothetical protein
VKPHHPMIKWSRRSIVGAFAACVVAAVVVCAAAAGVTSFADPAGDAAGAPDVTSVTVTDDAAGLATLSVTIAADLPLDDDIDVYVDSNKDNQADYYFEAYRDTATHVGWDVEHYDGKGWSTTPDSGTETFSRSGNVYTWTFSQADIGGSTGFNFWIFTHHYAGEAVAARDLGPDDGAWSFVYAKSQGDVQVPTSHALASHGRAGKPLHLRFSVNDDSGSVATSIVIYKGTQRVTTKTYGLQKVDGGNYWAPWTSARRGTYKFCVTAKDKAGNVSKPSCAAVTVS